MPCFAPSLLCWPRKYPPQKLAQLKTAENLTNQLLGNHKGDLFWTSKDKTNSIHTEKRSGAPLPLQLQALLLGKAMLPDTSWGPKHPVRHLGHQKVVILSQKTTWLGTFQDSNLYTSVASVLQMSDDALH